MGVLDKACDCGEISRRVYFTIVNVSFRVVDPTRGVVAVMTSVYLPGLRCLCLESQPSNLAVFLPAWPSNVSEPRTSVRVHLPSRLLWLVCATQWPLTLRPAPGCVKSKRTDAALSS